MSSTLAQIEFYFPKNLEQIKTKKDLVNFIVGSIKKEKAIQHCGFLQEQFLSESIFENLGEGKLEKSITLTQSEQLKIKNLIQ